RAAADQARPLPALSRPSRPGAHARARARRGRRPPVRDRRARGRVRRRGHGRRTRRRRRDRLRRHPTLEPRGGFLVMSKEILEAERDMMFEEYRDRVGELVTGIVQQSDSRYTLVQLRERVEALLPKSEQIDAERYEHSGRIKAVIKEVSASTKGPSIIVSRRDPELIKTLFELEVPEIADGPVELTDVAREPGYRSKIAVISHADGVDPVGACVGPRGSRVRMVESELRG